MTIDEAIERFKSNAKYERKHGNLQGCLEFAQLVDWLSKYQQMQSDYENCLKAERKKIAEDVAVKMDYMGSCLNEKNIILGIITGKRKTLDSLCSTCKSESCVSNGTAIPKADYENRLKADLVAMLIRLNNEIDDLRAYDDIETVDKCEEIIQQKINKLKEA